MRFMWAYENSSGIDNTWAKVMDTENGDHIVATAENGIMAQAFCNLLNGAPQKITSEGLVYVN